MPERVQLSRKKGWRMPPNTVKVDRSTKFGNPFPFTPGSPDGRRIAVDRFRRWIGGEKMRGLKPAAECYPDPSALRGKNLACWCPLDEPCHADVLLERANS